MIFNATNSRRSLVTFATGAVAVVAGPIAAATPLAGQHGGTTLQHGNYTKPQGSRRNSLSRNSQNQSPGVAGSADELDMRWADVLLAGSGKFLNQMCGSWKELGHLGRAGVLLSQCYRALSGDKIITSDGALVEDAWRYCPLVLFAKRVAVYAEEACARFQNASGLNLVEPTWLRMIRDYIPLLQKIRELDEAEVTKLHTLWTNLRKAAKEVAFHQHPGFKDFPSFLESADNLSHNERAATLVARYFAALKVEIIQFDGTLVVTPPWIDKSLVRLTERVREYAQAAFAHLRGDSMRNSSQLELFEECIPIFEQIRESRWETAPNPRDLNKLNELWEDVLAAESSLRSTKAWELSGCACPRNDDASHVQRAARLLQSCFFAFRRTKVIAQGETSVDSASLRTQLKNLAACVAVYADEAYDQFRSALEIECVERIWMAVIKEYKSKLLQILA